jgi:hypothetical protein
LKFLFLRNTKILIFGGISMFHLWTGFGKFGQIWADFVALQWLRACPKQG